VQLQGGRRWEVGTGSEGGCGFHRQSNIQGLGHSAHRAVFSLQCGIETYYFAAASEVEGKVRPADRACPCRVRLSL
jgi:hypothetical protein